MLSIPKFTRPFTQIACKGGRCNPPMTPIEVRIFAPKLYPINYHNCRGPILLPSHIYTLLLPSHDFCTQKNCSMDFFCQDKSRGPYFSKKMLQQKISKFSIIRAHLQCCVGGHDPLYSPLLNPSFYSFWVTSKLAAAYYFRSPLTDFGETKCIYVSSTMQQ